MQSQNLFTSQLPNAPAPEPKSAAAPSGSSTTAFVNYISAVDERTEKKQFIKTILVSTAIFTTVSAVVFGFILSNRINTVNGQSATPLKPIYRDGAQQTIIATKKPPRISGAVLPTGAVTPGISPDSSPSVPVPTRVTIINTPTITPTFTPTPTGVLYVSADDDLDFSEVTIGSEKTIEFTVRNTGNSPVVINSIGFTKTGSTNPYSLSSGSSSACLTNGTTPYTIQSNSEKCIQVKYRPTTVTVNDGKLQIVWNVNNIKYVDLTGTVPTATETPTPTPTVTPTFTITPTPTGTLYVSAESGGVDFGEVSEGGSMTSDITLRNIGESIITINSMFFATSGPLNPFSIQSGTSTCLTSTELPYGMPSNASRCLEVKFSPTASTTNTNTLMIYWNNSNLKTISLNGVIPTRTPTPTP